MRPIAICLIKMAFAQGVELEEFAWKAREFRRFDLGLETLTAIHTAIIAVRIAVHKDSIGRAQEPAKIFKVS